MSNVTVVPTPTPIRLKFFFTMFRLLPVFACGCAQWDLMEQVPFAPFAAEAEVAIPDRLIPIWTHTVLNQPSKPGVRGFGGRVMFYNGDQQKPVKVDGTLTVYAFDGSLGGIATGKPERKYVFTPEQLANHYSETMLGHSYSFWLPWDKAGGELRKLSLVARFEPLDGPATLSEASQQVLPGISREVQAELKQRTGSSTSPRRAVDAANDGYDSVPATRLQRSNHMLDAAPAGGEIRQAAFETADNSYGPVEPTGLTIGRQHLASNELADKEAMTTITIDVPHSFAERNLAAPQIRSVPPNERDTAPQLSDAANSGSHVTDAQYDTRETEYILQARAEQSATRIASDSHAPDAAKQQPERFARQQINFAHPLPYQERWKDLETETGEVASARLSRLDRFGRPLFPVRAAPAPRPMTDHLLRQHSPQAWPSGRSHLFQSSQTGRWQRLPAENETPTSERPPLEGQ
jgi:hypothetical protein